VPADVRQDPVFIRSGGADTGRDGCRVPLPCTATGPSFGFGVLHFRRPGGWHSVTNFGAGPVELPPGRLILASVPAHGGVLAAKATAWILDHGA
jgi:hypothetical protein